MQNENKKRKWISEFGKTSLNTDTFFEFKYYLLFLVGLHISGTRQRVTHSPKPAAKGRTLRSMHNIHFHGTEKSGFRLSKTASNKIPDIGLRSQYPDVWRSIENIPALRPTLGPKSPIQFRRNLLNNIHHQIYEVKSKIGPG